LDPTPSIIIPENSEFRTSPSYQRLNDYEGVEYNTFDYENNSYVQSLFNVNDDRNGIIKSISSASYSHTSSLTLYDNLYYLNQGKNTVFSVQKEDNSTPIFVYLFATVIIGLCFILHKRLTFKEYTKKYGDIP
jgi:hypothetical protein